METNNRSHKHEDTLDKLACTLEGKGLPKLASMLDSVSNTVASGSAVGDSSAILKNAGLMDVVNKMVKPLGKAIDAGVSKLLGNRTVQEKLVGLAKKVNPADLTAALEDRELLGKVSDLASRMSAADLQRLLSDPAGYERYLESKLQMQGAKTAASGLSKGILMALMVLTLMKTVHAGDLPTQVGAGHGGAHTTLDSSHGGDGHGGDAKAPGVKDTADTSKYNKAIDKNLPKTFEGMAKAMDSDSVKNLFDGKTDIDFSNLGQEGVNKMVNSTINDAIKISVVHSAITGMLMGSTDPAEVSPEARGDLSQRMHSVIMEKLGEDAGWNPVKQLAVKALSGKVLKALNLWFSSNDNIKRAIGPVAPVKTA